jgi:hypothetical protein
MTALNTVLSEDDVQMIAETLRRFLPTVRNAPRTLSSTDAFALKARRSVREIEVVIAKLEGDGGHATLEPDELMCVIVVVEQTLWKSAEHSGDAEKIKRVKGVLQALWQLHSEHFLVG